MDNFKITKTILENINEQNDRINECVDIVNGYTTDEETRVNQELQRQQNELRREEQYNNNENRFNEINTQLESKASINDKIQLQGQIDNLVLEAGKEEPTITEVVQARGEFSLLNERLSNIENLFEKLDVIRVDAEIQNGYYIATSGKLTTSNNYNYTSPIQLNSGQSLYVLSNTKGTNVKAIGLCTIDGEHIQGGTNGEGDLDKWYKYTATEDCFVRCCSYKKTSMLLYITIDKARLYDFNLLLSDVEKNTNNIDLLLSGVEKNTNSIDIYKAIFNNVICIGDSLTAGSRGTGATPYTVPEISYPIQLGKLTGWDVTRDGHPGISASGYYNNQACNKDYSKYDTAIIFLGTNEGLTDSVEEGLVDTNTGCYMKLIEKLKNDNPKINIFLCSLFAKKWAETTNPVINKIADKYNLKVIDCNLEKYSSSKHELYNVFHPFDSIHMDRIGYLDFANHVKDSIYKIVSENLSDYNYK